VVLEKCGTFRDCKELDAIRSICKPKKHEKRISIQKDWFEDMLDPSKCLGNMQALKAKIKFGDKQAKPEEWIPLTTD
jgi:hypothetical protein